MTGRLSWPAAAGRASRPAALLCAAALALLAPAFPATAGVPAGIPIARIRTAEKVIALSFDDGPQATPVLDTLLDVLARRHAHATFFVIGRELVAHPEIGRRLLEDGHELGSHTWSHPRLDSITVDSMRIELARTDSLLRALGEKGRILLRPPYGAFDASVLKELKRRHRIVTLFDVDPSYDFAQLEPDSVVARTVLWLGPGSILVMHPWYQDGAATVAELPRILDWLQGLGYRITTVSELLATKHARVELSEYHLMDR